MPKKWSEKEIETTFKHMPGVKDNRSAEEILERLKADERLQEIAEKKRKPISWIPVAVAIAAVFFISLLIPSVLKKISSQPEQATNFSFEQESKMMNEEAEIERAASFAEEAALSDGNNYAVLQETLDEYFVFQIGLVFNEQVIPTSFLIPIEKVNVDFPNGKPNSVQLYEKYASKIPEEALGFTPYHPYGGSFTVSGETITHHAINDSSYVNDPLYEGIIRETFKDFKQWHSTIEREEESITLIHLQDEKNAFYKYTSSTGQSYLVKETQDSLTVKDALLNMATPPHDEVEVLIPEYVHYDITVENKVAHVQFHEELDLRTMDREEAVMLIEGFMLTAAEFNMRVQFENISPSTFERYELFAPLPTPIGSNPIYFSFE